LKTPTHIEKTSWLTRHNKIGAISEIAHSRVTLLALTAINVMPMTVNVGIFNPPLLLTIT